MHLSCRPALVLFVICALTRLSASSMHASFRGKAMQTHDKLGSIGATRELQSTVLFKLIYTVTDTVFTDILQNSTINVGSLSNPNDLSIEAVVAPGINHGSAILTLSGTKNITRIENPAIYALCGNQGNDFWRCNLETGTYKITADIYSARSATGTKVTSDFVEFTIINDRLTLPSPVVIPTMQPTKRPTTRNPVTSSPSMPVVVPTFAPVSTTTSAPTTAPTSAPAPYSTPTTAPVSTPTTSPAFTPTTAPTSTPTTAPTSTPTTAPVSTPASAPVSTPASAPVSTPTTLPTSTPTSAPAPDSTPATTPVSAPTSAPAPISALAPDSAPTTTPVAGPTTTPVAGPTTTPVAAPTTTPVAGTTTTPVAAPTTTPVAAPTTTPFAAPSSTPTSTPTSAPIPNYSGTVSFRLIDATTDAVVSDIFHNSVIDIGNFSASALTIEAVVAPGIQHVSARLILSGTKSISKVEHPLYGLCGNSGRDFSPCNLEIGSYKIAADVFAERSANGLIVAHGAVDFKIRQGIQAPSPIAIPTMRPTNRLTTGNPNTSSPLTPVVVPVVVPVSTPTSVPTSSPTTAPAPKSAPAPASSPTSAPAAASVPVSTPTSAPIPAYSGTVSFRLIDATTDAVVSDILQNSVIYIGNFSASALTIEAVVAPGIQHVSARLILSGTKSISKVEHPLYGLCGNSGRDFSPCNLEIGSYKIVADIFSERSAEGLIVAQGAVDFDIRQGVQGPVPRSSPVSRKPTTSPISLPTSKPVSMPVPVSGPVHQSLPTSEPAPVALCSIPKLVGGWVSWPQYPIPVAESMGAIIGNDFVIVSGFAGTWENTTTKVFSFDVTNSTAVWRQLDDVPVPGFHHAAFAVHGSVMYICGAYVGGVSVIKSSRICFKYSHNAPTGEQWYRFPDLPGERGGGGMNRIVESNSLVYATGATRPPTTDWNTTWEISLNNLSAGWEQRASIPYRANHISHVTAYYNGRKRYYYLGGQMNGNEGNGNVNDLVEWDQATKSWIRRKNMTLARGHASASTIAYGCGFIMIGGAINSGTSNQLQTADISYYGIDTDTWVSIGSLPSKINTPVCDIAYNITGSDWIYCQTGHVWGYYSWKRKISLL